MSATFQNSAMVLSIGVFFTLMVVGLAASLPATMQPRARRAGRARGGRAPRRRTCRRSALLFASFLG